MIRSSAFADEISADLSEQIAVLQSENIHALDLRSLWDTNVLDLTDRQVAEARRALDACGVRVASIGSPIGKVPIDISFDDHLLRFERAVALAHLFETPYIRIFSFYPPKGSEPAAQPPDYRGEVLARLRAMTARAQAANVILLHENDTELYGATVEGSVDLLTSVNSSHLQAVLDPANFILSGQTPYPDGYEALRPWLRSIHVKDAREDGAVTVAGEGVGRWPELLQRLRADDYGGTFSLEPHLAAAGRYQGFSGPQLFRQASQTFQRLLREAGWESWG